MPNDEFMTLDQAVRLLMKRTGRTRRQAEQAILQKLKSGEIRAQGIPAGGEDPEEIPVDVFRAIPSEH